jgi:alpha-tubulin suppressor-like RCC1 family protein
VKFVCEDEDGIMKPVNATWRRAAATVCGVGLGMIGMSAGPPDISPSNPTVSMGHTQQFAVNGAIVPTGVSAGGEYTCVRLSDTTMQCTGRNQFGQHGDGTIVNTSTLDPSPGLAGVSAAVAGDEFNCALMIDGTARCWGLGEKGQRGDGSFVQFTLSPSPVSNVTNAVALGAGYDHACALLADGTMQCWGDNTHGQLGNASVTSPTAVPVQVTGVSGVFAMTVGGFHTCAVMADHTVQCWGRNDLGQLGDGTSTDAFSPVVVSGLSGVSAVSGGGSHTCALVTGGSVYCWGDGYDGQLGQGAFVPSTTPVQVSGVSTAVAIAAGWTHTCALLQDGTVSCWGSNVSGQLGNGTTQSQSTPVTVGGIASATGVSAGWFHHSCAIVSGGNVSCWGENTWGQLGNGTTTNASLPVHTSGTGITWTSSSPFVATIDSKGVATAWNPGTATITATDSTGASPTTTLTVPQRFLLAVTPAGAGFGSVTSSPSGITCGLNCSAGFDSGTVVTLTATPSANSIVAGWIGCDSTTATTCTVTMNGARSVTAVFDLKRFTLSVDRTGVGKDLGTVTSSPDGINCGTTCSAVYTIGTVVTLTASPSILLSGWTGCDTVNGATCTVTMGSAKSVSARFVTLP